MSDVEVELVFSAVGEPAGETAIENNTQGVSELADSYMPYVPPPSLRPRDPSLCHGNEYTCGARKANGTEFCAGHLRSAGLL